jgi:ParB/RepB/Spo0J family partition protein
MTPISTIRPYWRNPRKNENAVPAVKASIEQFGFVQPIVVDKSGEIIIGHTRYRAAIELGLEQVPVIWVKLSKAKARELRIADNKTAERADWDKDKLIEELRGTDRNIMALFFDEPDLAKLLTESNGSIFRPVSAEQLDKVIDRHNNGMADLINRPQVGLQIKLVCPHCCEEFNVDRSIIEEHEGEA